MEDDVFAPGYQFQSMSFMFLCDEFALPDRAYITADLGTGEKTQGYIYTQKISTMFKTDFMVFSKEYFTDKKGASVCPFLSNFLFSMYKIKQQLWTKRGHLIMGIIWSNEISILDKFHYHKIGEIISWPYPRLQKEHFVRTKKLVKLSDSQTTFLRRNMSSRELTPICWEYVMDASIQFTTLQSVFQKAAKKSHKKVYQRRLENSK